MRRFFVEPGDIKDGRAVVRDGELRHLARVVRLSVGDAVSVIDGEGWEYPGVIESLTEKEAFIRVGDPIYFSRESPLEVWLAQGIPKGDKMDLIIQKVTELGVRGVVPLETERTVVRYDNKKRTAKRERWQKTAQEAAKQCGRSLLPEVCLPQTLPEYLAGLSRENLLLIPWEEGGRPLREVVQGSGPKGSVHILIGPEGGWAKREVDLAKAKGGIPVTLGPRILRTETAGLAVVSAVMFQWGDFGR